VRLPEQAGADLTSAAETAPACKRFLVRTARMRIVLPIAAGPVCMTVSDERKTVLVILVVVVFNAAIGLVGEIRAEKSTSCAYVDSSPVCSMMQSPGWARREVASATSAGP